MIKSLVSVLLLLPTLALAQGGPCNPYDEACADRLARELGLPVPATRCTPTAAGIVCRDTTTGEALDATVYTFGEGVVHAPGSELAWVILTNFDMVPQTVVVELLVSGRPAPVTRIVTLAPKERKDLSLHDLNEFGGGYVVTFSTGVYFPLATGHASLVMRPQTDVWSRVALPPATVTRMASTTVVQQP